MKSDIYFSVFGIVSCTSDGTRGQGRVREEATHINEGLARQKAGLNDGVTFRHKTVLSAGSGKTITILLLVGFFQSPIELLGRQTLPDRLVIVL